MFLSGWAAADDSLKQTPSFIERSRMKGSFSPTCDRYGHILTGIGGSPQAMAPFVLPSAEEIALFPRGTGIGLAATGDGQRNGLRSKESKVSDEVRYGTRRE